MRCTGMLGLSLLFVFCSGFASLAKADVWTFAPLGDLPGGADDCHARTMSPEGAVVVGWSISAAGEEAFQWTQASGMIGLGDLPGGSFGSNAEGVSDNGSVIVGSGQSASGQEAFRRTSDGAMTGLGDLAGGDFESRAMSVSRDGSVAVGWGTSASGREAFRHTSSGGMVGLGDLPGGTFYSHAWAVSADGNTVVGTSESAAGTEAFVWTQSAGMVGLGDLPSGIFESHAKDVSADGSVITGNSMTALGREAFLWTAEDGMIGLGDLPGGEFISWARGISADGLQVVGASKTEDGDEAFLWDAENGMRSIPDLLIADGVDLTGWTVGFAHDISADGRHIIGVGTNPDGNPAAWLVSRVPEPSSVCLLAFYNNSSWDYGGGVTDDDAIVPDKVALLPGVTATLANYTSYDKGINGLMIDLYGLADTPTLNDFLFRWGNDDEPYGDDLSDPADDWPWAPDPIVITMRPGEGQDGADRVTLIWEDGVIRNCWLQVTVMATDATGLAEDQVFYVGNAVGESGNSTADALVNATDEIGARNNPHSPFNPALIDDAYDFNRDALVNATDQIIARNNRTSPFTALKLITPPLEGQ